MKFVDLFSGLGGFHIAAAKFGGECVFACEINAALRQVYERNFGVTPAADIGEVDAATVPDHDLLCAGFPCQPFSKAGEQSGWADVKRGTLFDKVVQVLKAKQPEYLILENVAHFVNHDEGNTYQRVRFALEELGYEVKHGQLSPHHFGVPQIRERMYMVGRLGAGLGSFEFPKPQTESSSLSITSILETAPEEALSLGPRTIACLKVWDKFLKRFPANEKLPSFPIWSMEFGATYPVTYDTLYKVPVEVLRNSRGSFGASLNVNSFDECLARVPSHARYVENAFPKWKQTFINQNRKLFSTHRDWLADWLPSVKQFPSSLQKCEWNCQGEERDIWKYVIQFRASGVRIKRATTAPSLVAMTTTQVPIIAWEKRYMTVRECARLQSMGALKWFPKGNAAFEALGNAVNVTVAEKVLANLLSTQTAGHRPSEPSQLIKSPRRMPAAA